MPAPRAAETVCGDPSADGPRACVLFVDLQEGLLEVARTVPAAGLRRGAAALAAVAGALGMPCFASAVPTGPGSPAPLIGELSLLLDGAATYVRGGFGAAGHPGVAAFIGPACGRLLVAGVLTEGAVLRTALDARRRGWEAHVVLDACAGLSRRTEEAAIRQIEAAGGVATSVASVAALSDVNLSGASGRAVLLALRTLLAGGGAGAGELPQ